MMKNAFYFNSKADFVLKIFKFLSGRFGRIAKQFDQKDKINLKFYDVTIWLKNNQTMKFGQLVEYNMRNVFLEKSYTKYGEETSPRPFSGRLKLSIALDQQPKVLRSLFLFNPKLRAIKILKLSYRPLAFTSY